MAIFASGSGTNMQRITEYFAGNPGVDISLLVCNKAGAGVIDRAKQLGVPHKLIDRQSFYGSAALSEELISLQIDLIVLAGFLWLIPDHLLKAFPDRILNIHPALLPRYGGKGMYGMKVHEAVIAARETTSGITIHLVNAHYDEGTILFQESIALAGDETPESLATRIHALEYQHFPLVIEKYLWELTGPVSS